MEEGRSYLIEFVRIGHQVKATACDPDSGLEVSIIGPHTATRKALSDLAIKKLLYMMRKRSGD